MKSTINSNHLGAICEIQFQAALHHFSHGCFISTQVTSRGLSGQNFILTSTVGEFVPRGSPHNPEQLPSERFFAGQVHAHTTVVSPWPHQMCASSGIFGCPIGLMRQLHGIQLDDELRKTCSPQERAAIAEVVDDTLATSDPLTFPSAGDMLPAWVRAYR